MPRRGAVGIIRTREPTARTKVEGMDQMAQIDNRYAGRVGARTDVARGRGSPRVHAARLQLHGRRRVPHRPRCLRHLHATRSPPIRRSPPAPAASVMALHRGMYLTPFGAGDLRLPAEVGADARSARVRILPVLAHLQDERRRGSAGVLAVRGGDGRLAVVIFLRLHRPLDHAGVLRDGRGLRRAQHLRLHHPEGSLWLGLVPDHGRDRHRRGRSGEHLAAVRRVAVRHLRDRRAGVRRPHRLRHPADQGQLLLGDG